MRIRNTGAASPGLGGFHSSINSRANAVFVQIFRAKIPTGHSVVQASNSMGSSYGDVWITDTAGTGKWEWYGRIIYCGESGSFSSGGHVYLNGNAGTSSSPLYWYISYCQVYDLTKGRYDGLRCRYADEVTNADTVDGYHASGLFTNLSNSGNNISITVGGTNKTLTPAYATNAGTASNSNALGGYSLGTSSTSGTWNKVPLVKSDGVIEIGRYIDMHFTNTSTKDYGTRIQISSDAGNVLTLPTSSGTLCLTNHSHSEYYSSNISRSANTVLAAPNGSSGSATFRRLVAADIPALDYMSKKGDYSQPIVLAAGYVYRSSGSSSSWYFSGSKVSAISSVSCSVSGGVMTITFNPSSGHSIYCYAACANMATSGDMPSYTGNYSGRSGGAEWMGTYCSGGSSIWMRQMAQSNSNNDSWHSDNMNKSDGPTRITLIVCGYHS